MVDYNSSEIVPSADIFALSTDKLDSVAAIFYSQAMSVIKLLQRGTTKVSKLPSGVFQCILECQFPKLLLWWYSVPSNPIMGEQDRHFPAISMLNYENYLFALNVIDFTNQYKFSLRDGADCGTKGTKDNWTRVQIN